MVGPARQGEDRMMGSGLLGYGPAEYLRPKPRGFVCIMG